MSWKVFWVAKKQLEKYNESFLRNMHFLIKKSKKIVEKKIVRNFLTNLKILFFFEFFSENVLKTLLRGRETTRKKYRIVFEKFLKYVIFFDFGCPSPPITHHPSIHHPSVNTSVASLRGPRRWRDGWQHSKLGRTWLERAFLKKLRFLNFCSSLRGPSAATSEENSGPSLRDIGTNLAGKFRAWNANTIIVINDIEAWLTPTL